jgi:hypothetical protein
MRPRRTAVKEKGRKAAGTMPCVSQRAGAVARMRNGVLLFDLEPGARKPGMALVNRLRDEE